MIKTLGKILGLLALAGIGLLVWGFSPGVLPVGAAPVFALPAATPPPEMKFSTLSAGHMMAQAMMAYRGGAMGDERSFAMGGVLVQHPQVTLLFDTGFGRNVDQHVLTTPVLMQKTSKYFKETAVADQLNGLKLDGIVLTHAHWDHVSGIEDLPDVPVWINAAEEAFIKSGNPHTALIRSFSNVNYKLYDYSDGPYLGFERSLDVFKDGSVVLVPAVGHTPGSTIAFIATPDGKRYALLGDLVWQKEGLDLPAERPWLPRTLADDDPAAVRALIVRMHHIQNALPITMVPAHDQRVWDALPKFAG